MIIGVTGSIGTGKTAVAGMLKRQGAYVIDADRIVHRILDKPARNKLAAFVFDDRRKLQRLCRVIHPLVKREILARLRAHQSKKAVVIDAPLLIECALDRFCDYLVVVKAYRKKQLERASEKLSVSKRQIAKRIRLQMPLKKKIARADFVIDNNGSLENTERQVKKMWDELAGRRKWKK